MSGQRLRAALADAGLTGEELADLVKVDRRTVRRWLAGLTPRRRQRIKVAKILETREEELWPHTTTEPRPEPEQSDSATVHIPGDDGRVPDWRHLLQQASQQIEIYDWNAAGLLAHPEILAQLTAKAAAGTAVRVLVASLQSLWLAMDDVEPDAEGPRSIHGRPLYQSIERAHELLLAFTEQGKVEALPVIAPRSPSILRFDEHILAAVHTWSNPAPGPIVLYVQRHADHGPFQQLCAHFDAMWKQAWPVDHCRRQDENDYAAPAPDPAPGKSNGRGWRRRAILAPYGRRPPRRRT